MNRHFVLNWICFSSLLMLGCGASGESGPERYEVTGKVTYNGTLVPYGNIIFEPDRGQGNTGPATTGIIENGAYSIGHEKGVIPGALVVRIVGYDGKSPPGGGTMPHGKPLFPEYKSSVTQSREMATHDFDIKK